MKNIRILIVDDVPSVREGLALLLQLAASATDLKMELIGEAQNGCEAIEKTRSLRPDVVLMDLEMPVMDGYEATRQIKSHQSAPRVIMLSVHAEPEDRARAKSVGADSFVIKGASYEVLVAAILGV
jgi:DNA-binding NarL/FixJ family response regulator